MTAGTDQTSRAVVSKLPRMLCNVLFTVPGIKIIVNFKLTLEQNVETNADVSTRFEAVRNVGICLESSLQSQFKLHNLYCLRYCPTVFKIAAKVRNKNIL